MLNNYGNFRNASPAVFGNSGRPITAMPGLGLGHDLAAAANAGKQNPNPAAKVKSPTAVPATAAGIQSAAKTASLMDMLTKYAQGAPVPGPAGIPPAPGSAAVVQPPPPGPTPPPQPAPSPIPANPRQQPPRERTEEDDKQEFILNSVLAEGQEARELPDRSPTRELESDLMTHGKVAHDAISAFNKFASLYKKARQDNSKPSRSAMGESNGLTYEQRKDDHATGSDAWSSLDRFRRKESNDKSLSGAYVDHCLSRGLSVDQIADSIVKLGNEFGAATQKELINDLEKQAAPNLQTIYNVGKRLWSPGGRAVIGGITGAGGAGEDASWGETALRGAIGAGTFAALPGGAKAAPVAQQAAKVTQVAQKAAPVSLATRLASVKPQVSTRLPTPTVGSQALNAAKTTGKAVGGVVAGIGAGGTIGAATGNATDQFLAGEGNPNAANSHHFRDAGQYIGASLGAFAPTLAPFMAAPLFPGVGVGYQRFTGKQLFSPIVETYGKAAGRGAAEGALESVPEQFKSVDPTTGRQRFDIDKAQKEVSDRAGTMVDDYIKNKFGGLDQYVQQYTNPLFQAMGYDVANMSPWQRYSILGGGLMMGAGGLMENPYLMGAGGLLAGGGAYPQLAMMANPHLRKQFGVELPGANPFYQSVTRPTPSPAQ